VGPIPATRRPKKEHNAGVISSTHTKLFPFVEDWVMSSVKKGTLTEGEGSDTVYLSKVACFVTKVNIFST